jgi:hypothetical protein
MALPLHRIRYDLFLGSHGNLFPIGLCSIITYLVLTWRFIETSDPKLLFLLLYTAALVYFIPITWDHDFRLWKLLCSAGGFYLIYFLLGYLLPAVIQHHSASRST